MKIVYRLLLVLLISLFLFGCGGKKGGSVEGKVVDGQGQPLSGVTLIFKQVRPVPGTEPLQAKTGTDGIFNISGLTPASEYIITPEADKWTTKVTRKITAGQSLALSPPIAIRFQLLRNGTIIDTKTGLQWLIYTATDIGASNVIKTVKNVNEGGFSDWRLPTKAEIIGLKDQASGVSDQAESKSTQQACCVWTAEINSDSFEWEFYVDDGNELWTSSRMPPNDRVVVVRTYGASPTMAQAPTIVVPSPPAAALNKQATPSPAPAPAPTPAPPAATVAVPAPTAKVASPGAPPAAKVAAVPAPVAKKEVAAPPEPQKPAPPPPPPKVAPEEKVAVVPTGGNTVVLHFGVNKSAINATDLAALKAFYTKIKGATGKLVIEGHADTEGTAAANLSISINRAVNTWTQLKNMGLSNKIKVEVMGVGDAKSVADNKTPEGRNKNRRVELTFTPG